MIEEDLDIAIKVVIVGNGAVGKSSMIQRYCKGIFTKDYKKTIGVDFLERQIDVDGEDVRLMLWDTAGQEEFDAITKAYYRGEERLLLIATWSVLLPKALLRSVLSPLSIPCCNFLAPRLIFISFSSFPPFSYPYFHLVFLPLFFQSSRLLHSFLHMFCSFAEVMLSSVLSCIFYLFHAPLSIFNLFLFSSYFFYVWISIVSFFCLPHPSPLPLPPLHPLLIPPTTRRSVMRGGFLSHRPEVLRSRVILAGQSGGRDRGWNSHRARHQQDGSHRIR